MPRKHRLPPAGSTPAPVCLAVNKKFEALIHELFTGTGEVPPAGVTAARLRIRLGFSETGPGAFRAAARNLANPHSKEVIP
jgi:hypothetical protein